MTDQQITSLMEDGLKRTIDLLFAYLAQIEIRITALEHILQRKNIIISREEIENEAESLLKHKFPEYIRAYDSLVDNNHKEMLHLRSQHS